MRPVQRRATSFCLPEGSPALEDDFKRPDFWTKKAPAKQSRVQLNDSLNTPCPTVLHVVCSAGLCLIDTCSDVSLARRKVDDPVIINHLGGETCLQQAGSFLLESLTGSPIVLHEVFTVESRGLPAGVVALLGFADVRLLGLSLDQIADSPCSWSSRHSSFSSRGDVPRPACPVLPATPMQIPLSDRRLEEELAARAPRSVDAAQRDFAAERPGVPAPFLLPSYLKELKERNRFEQENRTANHIGRLFL
jgi:hypothetical protein